MESGKRCLLCGCDRVRPLSHDCRSRRVSLPQRFEVYRCPACAAGFLSPRPPRELLCRLYSNGYRSHESSREFRDPFISGLRSLCLLPYRMRFGREGGILPPFGRGRLLDVGCGIGDYLLAMAGLGWSCCGLDVSVSALARARQRIPQAQFFQGTLETVSQEAGPFDLVTLWHTLEHLEDPLKTLQHVRELLPPEGKLMVAVPNLESMEARILGRRWLEIDIPGHLFFFSRKSLQALLEGAGFRCTRIRPQVHPSTVSDAVGFFLDDLTGKTISRQRIWLYAALFLGTAISYAFGNWGCLEVTAVRR